MLLQPTQVTIAHLGYQTLCVGYLVSVFRGPGGYHSLVICLQQVVHLVGNAMGNALKQLV